MRHQAMILLMVLQVLDIVQEIRNCQGDTLDHMSHLMTVDGWEMLVDVMHASNAYISAPD